MRKLKLDLEMLRVESFEAGAAGRIATVRAHEEETFVGDTNCGTCLPDSFGGTCQALGCQPTGGGDCSIRCTSWGCTDAETCATCATFNCGWGCTQQETCEYLCTHQLPVCGV